MIRAGQSVSYSQIHYSGSGMQKGSGVSHFFGSASSGATGSPGPSGPGPSSPSSLGAELAGLSFTTVGGAGVRHSHPPGGIATSTAAEPTEPSAGNPYPQQQSVRRNLPLKLANSSKTRSSGVKTKRSGLFSRLT
ncbi:unnamed protein product [Protopolystoma xenopodis]|uniref:Uncharacterized protein n=1 Tax=Protopolystoma xenopodis TaxID=117903 RepID=A0A448WWS4_9PLAT|nr:unnamed protein product [Protopolystoma xenopodis]